MRGGFKVSSRPSERCTVVVTMKSPKAGPFLKKKSDVASSSRRRVPCSSGADVNKADKDGASPVHFAAQRGHGALVIALISSAGRRVQASRVRPIHG